MNLNLVFTIPECLTEINKMVFTSQTHLLLLYLMFYSGNMFRLAIESSFRVN